MNQLFRWIVLPVFLALTLSAVSIPQKASAQEALLGEVRIFGFNFCPRGWAEANGQILPINQNQALYSLLGTIYGGDGRTSFALPDLRGRVVVGEGEGNPSSALPFSPLGQRGGAETVTMQLQHLPSHSHAVNANNLDGDKPGPANKLLAAAPTGGSGNETIYSTEPPNRLMSEAMISPAGGGLPIDIRDPKLGLLHCIALQGLFPSRN